MHKSKELYSVNRNGERQESGSESELLLPKEGTAASGSTPIRVMINLMKCTVGAGSFSFPHAFKTSGLWAGVVGTMILAVLGAYTMTILADSEKVFYKSTASDHRLTYPEVVIAAFSKRKYIGPFMKYLVYVAIVLTNLGICGAYTVFIGTTMPDIVPLTPVEIMFIIFPAVVGLALLRDFKYLAFTSILGDVAVSAGIIATVAQAVMHGKNLHNHHSDVNISGIAPAMANVAFLFLSHTVILPLSQSLHNDLGRPTTFRRVVWISLTVITIIHIPFAVVCYLYFGDDTESNVTQNLGEGTVLQIVKVLLCVDLLFTLPMLISPGREIIENSVLGSSLGQRKPRLTRDIVRIGCVVVIFGLSIGMVTGSGANKAFGNLVSLVGGLSGFLLGFIVPTLLYLESVEWKPKYGTLSIVLHLLLVLLGIVLTVVSTFFTVRGML